MSFVIVKSGGKQYRVKKDQELVVDRITGDVGDSVDLPTSLSASEGSLSFESGSAKVEIVEHLRGKKIHIYKYRAKKDSRKKTGHRQEQTRIKVLEV